MMTYGQQEWRPIPITDFNVALAEMEYQSAQWHHARYAEACRMCVESPGGRALLWTLLDHLVDTQRNGGDFSAPMVLLAGVMLKTGYMLGRRHAEAEVLEGWMRL